MLSMLFATSCSQDDLQNDPLTGDFINATFKLGTDDVLGSRAIGDGTSVDKVACAVYDAQGNELTELRQKVSFDGTTEDGKRKATFSTRLAKGHNYRVAFFAYNEAAGAYNVENLKNIVVNPGQLSNVEGRDAFTAYYNVETGKTMNIINETITLKRPFAQLNLGINDDEMEDARKAGIVVKNTKIVVSNVYNAFSAYDDAVVKGEAGEMVFELNDIPKEKLVINGKEYNYLAMNYLLVGDKGSEKSLTDVQFIYETTDGITNNPDTSFDYIPVQRNYRTNILGRLLTTPAEFTLVIDNSFEGTKAVLEPVDVNTWDEFTAAVGSIDPTYQYIRLCSDIEYDKNYTIEKDVTINLNGKSLEITNPEKMLNIGDKNNSTKPNVTITNGNLNCMVYALSGDVTIKDVEFGGTIAYVNASQGVISTKHANLLMENCKMTNVKKSGTTKPRSISTEGRSSGYLILRNCNFKNSNLDRPYINPLNGTATLELTNCALYGGASNIDLGASYVWSNMNLTGCSGGFTFTINRASTSFTDEETTIMKNIKKNNSGDVRLDWTDVQKMYIN